jgi:hypothetical protein
MNRLSSPVNARVARGSSAGQFLAPALAFPTAFALLLSASLHAGLAEPDNIVYGIIHLDGQPVTAARNDIVVEARRTPDGPAIGAYRMGDDRRVGDFYRLKLKLESAAPITEPEASLAGDRVYLLVRNASETLAQESFAVGQRGLLTRLDFDNANPDQDGNGLPDAWETFHFGHAANDPNADPDQDGHATIEEFLTGSIPNQRSSVCRLEVQLGEDDIEVLIQTRRAAGPGYEGYTRFYTLEEAVNPADGWFAVPGFTAIGGTDQEVTFHAPLTNAPAFYRAQVWLQAP